MNVETTRLMAGFPVCCTFPIQWGDQDAFAHVNNTVYLRWFESARIAYGAKVGLAQSFEARQIGPILAAISCNYRRQLIYPDTVYIGARITKVGRTSMVMEHRVVSESLRTVAAEGDSTLVMFDYGAQKPVPVSSTVRAMIAQLEGPDSPFVQLNLQPG
ncbi:MAG TPA: thioesterase family protein [Planctomycetaceae bacterium]|nr:thioesterase family protein [Planctomycetaceae bacterium]